MDKWVGNPETEVDFLMERSPITYVDNVRAPLLVIQGANDPRVVKGESDQMVERLRELERDVEYVVFDDEGPRLHEAREPAARQPAVGRLARAPPRRLATPADDDVNHALELRAYGRVALQAQLVRP